MKYCGFWKWSFVIFLAARATWAVDAVIGLWAVPQFVPSGDVGAVLPLAQFSTLLSLPVMVLVIPLARWLAIYSSHGEFGKVRSLLHLALPCLAFAVAAMAAVAYAVVPSLSHATRVSEAGLPMVMLAAGTLTALSPVFGRALQGLKRFGTSAAAEFISAPVRLVVSLTLMPTRAFTGYLAGTGAAALSNIVVSCIGLRRELFVRGASEPFWRTDGKAMFRYTVPVAFTLVTWHVFGTGETLLIRSNLSDVGSAAHFIFSSFDTLGSCVGGALLFVAFPIIAGAEAKDRDDGAVLEKTVYASLAAGLIAALVFLPLARPLLEAVPLWRPYAFYANYLPLYVLKSAMGATIWAFMNCEQARGSFLFLAYLAPIMSFGIIGIMLAHTLAAVAWTSTLLTFGQLLSVLWVIHRRRVCGS